MEVAGPTLNLVAQVGCLCHVITLRSLVGLRSPASVGHLLHAANALSSPGLAPHGICSFLWQTHHFSSILGSTWQPRLRVQSIRNVLTPDRGTPLLLRTAWDCGLFFLPSVILLLYSAGLKSQHHTENLPASPAIVRCSWSPGTKALASGRLSTFSLVVPVSVS